MTAVMLQLGVLPVYMYSRGAGHDVTLCTSASQTVNHAVSSVHIL